MAKIYTDNAKMNKVYSIGKLIINENILKADTNSLVWSFLVMDMYGETI